MLSSDDIHVLNTWLTIAERWEHRAKLIRETCERAFELRTMKGLDEMPAFAFNSQGIDPQYGGGGGGLPVGKHPVVISASALKPTSNGQGGYIEFTLTAIDGPAKGQTQLDRLNMHNPNPQAVEIANKQLAAYCAVTNTPSFQATEELHNKPFVVEIGLQKEPNQNKYVEVKALFDINGNEPGKAGAGPQTAGNGGGGFGGGQQGGGFGGQQGGGFGGGAGATGTGTIPDQNGGQGGGFGGFGGAGGGQQGGGQQGGGQWGGSAGAGAGGAGGGSGWQQGGGAGGQQGGGAGPGWGQR